MIEERRKRLAIASDLMGQTASIVDDVIGEELAAFDNLPENIQQSESGAAIKKTAEFLDEMHSELGCHQNELSKLAESEAEE